MSADSLASKFREAYPEFTELALRDSGGYLEIGSDKELVVRPHVGEWILESPEAHGHYETVEDAMAMAARALRGEVRFVGEFRGDLLARTWLEISEGHFFKEAHNASFLCPFDADEWELWPGEQWRQVRTTRIYNPVTGALITDQLERIADEGLWQSAEMLAWLEAGLGPAVEGMRWTVGQGPRFVFQVPRHWRRTEREHGEQSWLDFAGQDPTLMLRVHRYFREVELPLPHPVDHATRPTSIEIREESLDSGWLKIKWTLIFTDGEWDMMGVFELFTHSSANDGQAEEVRRMIEAAAPLSLYVPEEWNVTPAPD